MTQTRSISLRFPDSFTEQDIDFVFTHLFSYSRELLESLLDKMYLDTMEYRNRAKDLGDEKFIEEESTKLQHIGELRRKLTHEHT